MLEFINKCTTKFNKRPNNIVVTNMHASIDLPQLCYAQWCRQGIEIIAPVHIGLTECRLFAGGVSHCQLAISCCRQAWHQFYCLLQLIMCLTSKTVMMICKLSSQHCCLLKMLSCHSLCLWCQRRLYINVFNFRAENQAMDLSVSICDAKTALNLFLSNRFEEAIKRMEPW